MPAKRQKVSRSPELPADRTRPWRKIVPYFFMGAVFCLGFAAWLFVLEDRLAVAGRWILAAMVVAGLEYPFRKFSAGPTSLEDEFSTLSDTLCFVVVPGFLLYRLAFVHWGILGLAALFIPVFAGAARLAFHKMYHPAGRGAGYIGIPVTAMAALIALLAQVVKSGALAPEHRLGLLMLILVLSFVTLSTLAYPNPAEWPGFVAIACLAVFGLFLGGRIAEGIVWVLLALGGLYVLVAPRWARKGGTHHVRVR